MRRRGCQIEVRTVDHGRYGTRIFVDPISLKLRHWVAIDCIAILPAGYWAPAASLTFVEVIDIDNW